MHRHRAWLCPLVVVGVLSLPSLHAEELTVTNGTTTLVAPGDADCVKDLTIRNDSDQAAKRQDCPGNRATVALVSGITILPNTVDLTASTRFVKQFQVAPVAGAQSSSLLPVHITAPVSWVGALWNDSLGEVGSVGAYTNVNMFLRLTEGDPSDPAVRGSTVSETRFMGASHAGIAGCASVPKGKVAAAKMTVKCILAEYQKDEGDGLPEISAIVETGKTYNIELELLADVYSYNTGPAGTVHLGGHPIANFEANVLNGDPYGLTWNGPLSIAVGTDFQENTQHLEKEISVLRWQVRKLWEELHERRRKREHQGPDDRNR